MKRRRRSDFDWKYFFALIGTVVLFSAVGFVWGFNVGVQFG